MSKPRIAIISDLWGFNNDPYVNTYIEKLYNHFDVDLIDAQLLGDINPNQNESELHQQFIESGIALASERLVQSNIHFDAIIGFSIGGTIGWNAIHSGAKVDALFALSSTRLRNETIAIKKVLKLYFGELEEHGPDANWFNRMKITPIIVPNFGHLLYREPSFIKTFCEDLIEQYSENESCCS